MRLVRFQLYAVAGFVLVMAACSGPRPSHPVVTSPITGAVVDDSGDRRVLAGEWDYEELAVVLLTLDETGNGSYGWKKGHLRTLAFSGTHWEGTWLQEENDREGHFVVELTPDFSEGDGRWWYTRIGDDRAPTAKGGVFHLSRRALSLSASETPPAP